MELADVRNFQQACDYVLANEFVNGKDVRVPMSTLPDWVEAIAIMKRRDQSYGGLEGAPAELIDLVLTQLPLNVLVASFDRMLNRVDGVTS